MEKATATNEKNEESTLNIKQIISDLDGPEAAQLNSLRILGHLLSNNKKPLKSVQKTELINGISCVLKRRCSPGVHEKTFWCLTQATGVEFNEPIISDFIKCLDLVGQDSKSIGRCYEACNFLQRLTKEYEKELVRHLPIISRFIFTVVLHPATKIREVSFPVFEALYPVLLTHQSVISPELIRIVKASFAEDCLHLFGANQSLYALKILDGFLTLLGKELLQAFNAIVKLITPVFEKGFKSHNLEILKVTYAVWKTLIEDFSMDLDILSTSRWVRYLTKPLKRKLHNFVGVFPVIQDTYWKLVLNLKGRLSSNFDTVCIPLLEVFLLTSLEGSSSTVSSSQAESQTNPPLLKMACEMLIRFLEQPGNSVSNLNLRPQKIPGSSVEKLQVPIQTTVLLNNFKKLVKASGIIIFGLGKNKKFEPLLNTLLESLLHIVSFCPEDKTKSFGDALSFFLKLMDDIIKKELLSPNLCLKHLDNFTKLPQYMLTSPHCHLGHSALMHNNLAVSLSEMMLQSYVLSASNKKMSLNAALKRLIDVCILETPSPLVYGQIFMQLIKSEKAAYLTNAEDVMAIWCAIARPLLEKIKKTKEVNQGDYLEHDFSCLYSVLLCPISNFLPGKISKVNFDITLKLWTDLYENFVLHASSIPSVQGNLICNEFCQKLRAITLNESLKNAGYFECFCKMFQVMVNNLDFSNLIIDSKEGLAESSQSHQHKKNCLGDLTNITEILVLLLKIFHQQLCVTEIEEETQLKDIPQYSMALDLMANLFVQLKNSTVIPVFMSYATEVLCKIFVTTVKNENLASGLYSKLEQFWKIVSKYIVNNYLGPYDGNLFSILSPLLESTVHHPHQNIVDISQQFWLKTFAAHQSSLSVINKSDDSTTAWIKIISQQENEKAVCNELHSEDTYNTENKSSVIKTEFGKCTSSFEPLDEDLEEKDYNDESNYSIAVSQSQNEILLNETQFISESTDLIKQEEEECVSLSASVQDKESAISNESLGDSQQSITESPDSDIVISSLEVIGECENTQGTWKESNKTLLSLRMTKRKSISDLNSSALNRQLSSYSNVTFSESKPKNDLDSESASKMNSLEKNEKELEMEASKINSLERNEEESEMEASKMNSLERNEEEFEMEASEMNSLERNEKELEMEKTISSEHEITKTTPEKEIMPIEREEEALCEPLQSHVDAKTNLSNNITEEASFKLEISNPSDISSALITFDTTSNVSAEQSIDFVNSQDEIASSCETLSSDVIEHNDISAPVLKKPTRRRRGVYSQRKRKVKHETSAKVLKESEKPEELLDSTLQENKIESPTKCADANKSVPCAPLITEHTDVTNASEKHEDKVHKSSVHSISHCQKEDNDKELNISDSCDIGKTCATQEMISNAQISSSNIVPKSDTETLFGLENENEKFRKMPGENCVVQKAEMDSFSRCSSNNTKITEPVKKDKSKLITSGDAMQVNEPKLTSAENDLTSASPTLTNNVTTGVLNVPCVETNIGTSSGVILSEDPDVIEASIPFDSGTMELNELMRDHDKVMEDNNANKLLHNNVEMIENVIDPFLSCSKDEKIALDSCNEHLESSESQSSVIFTLKASDNEVNEHNYSQSPVTKKQKQIPIYPRRSTRNQTKQLQTKPGKRQNLKNSQKSNRSKLPIRTECVNEPVPKISDKKMKKTNDIVLEKSELTQSSNQAVVDHKNNEVNVLEKSKITKLNSSQTAADNDGMDDNALEKVKINEASLKQAIADKTFDMCEADDSIPKDSMDQLNTKPTDIVLESGKEIPVELNLKQTDERVLENCLTDNSILAEHKEVMQSDLECSEFSGDPSLKNSDDLQDDDKVYCSSQEMFSDETSLKSDMKDHSNTKLENRNVADESHVDEKKQSKSKKHEIKTPSTSPNEHNLRKRNSVRKKFCVCCQVSHSPSSHKCESANTKSSKKSKPLIENETQDESVSHDSKNGDIALCSENNNSDNKSDQDGSLLPSMPSVISELKGTTLYNDEKYQSSDDSIIEPSNKLVDMVQPVQTENKNVTPIKDFVICDNIIPETCVEDQVVFEEQKLNKSKKSDADDKKTESLQGVLTRRKRALRTHSQTSLVNNEIDSISDTLANNSSEKPADTSAMEAEKAPVGLCEERLTDSKCKAYSSNDASMVHSHSEMEMTKITSEDELDKELPSSSETVASDTSEGQDLDLLDHLNINSSDFDLTSRTSSAVSGRKRKRKSVYTHKKSRNLPKSKEVDASQKLLTEMLYPKKSQLYSITEEVVLEENGSDNLVEPIEDNKALTDATISKEHVSETHDHAIDDCSKNIKSSESERSLESFSNSKVTSDLCVSSDDVFTDSEVLSQSNQNQTHHRDIESEPIKQKHSIKAKRTYSKIPLCFTESKSTRRMSTRSSRNSIMDKKSISASEKNIVTVHQPQNLRVPNCPDENSEPLEVSKKIIENKTAIVDEQCAKNIFEIDKNKLHNLECQESKENAKAVTQNVEGPENIAKDCHSVEGASPDKELYPVVISKKQDSCRSDFVSEIDSGYLDNQESQFSCDALKQSSPSDISHTPEVENEERIFEPQVMSPKTLLLGDIPSTSRCKIIPIEITPKSAVSDNETCDNEFENTPDLPNDIPQSEDNESYGVLDDSITIIEECEKITSKCCMGVKDSSTTELKEKSNSVIAGCKQSLQSDKINDTNLDSNFECSDISTKVILSNNSGVLLDQNVGKNNNTAEIIVKNEIIYNSIDEATKTDASNNKDVKLFDTNNAPEEFQQVSDSEEKKERCITLKRETKSSSADKLPAFEEMKALYKTDKENVGKYHPKKNDKKFPSLLENTKSVSDGHINVSENQSSLNDDISKNVSADTSVSKTLKMDDEKLDYDTACEKREGMPSTDEAISLENVELSDIVLTASNGIEFSQSKIPAITKTRRKRDHNMLAPKKVASVTDSGLSTVEGHFEEECSPCKISNNAIGVHTCSYNAIADELGVLPLEPKIVKEIGSKKRKISLPVRTRKEKVKLNKLLEKSQKKTGKKPGKPKIEIAKHSNKKSTKAMSLKSQTSVQKNVSEVLEENCINVTNKISNDVTHTKVKAEKKKVSNSEEKLKTEKQSSNEKKLEKQDAMQLINVANSPLKRKMKNDEGNNTDKKNRIVLANVVRSPTSRSEMILLASRRQNLPLNEGVKDSKVLSPSALLEEMGKNTPPSTPRSSTKNRSHGLSRKRLSDELDSPVKLTSILKKYESNPDGRPVSQAKTVRFAEPLTCESNNNNSSARKKIIFSERLNVYKEKKKQRKLKKTAQKKVEYETKYHWPYIGCSNLIECNEELSKVPYKLLYPSIEEGMAALDKQNIKTLGALFRLHPKVLLEFVSSASEPSKLLEDLKTNLLTYYHAMNVLRYYRKTFAQPYDLVCCTVDSCDCCSVNNKQIAASSSSSEATSADTVTEEKLVRSKPDVAPSEDSNSSKVEDKTDNTVGDFVCDVPLSCVLVSINNSNPVNNKSDKKSKESDEVLLKKEGDRFFQSDKLHVLNPLTLVKWQQLLNLAIEKALLKRK